LAAAVADAQSAQFKIVRWWWRGQPAIDWVSAVLEVQPKDLGETISTVAQLQGAGTNVTADVFPYGLPQLDRVHVHVKVGLAIR
jgi:shikimate 5-dehydrogenase